MSKKPKSLSKRAQKRPATTRRGIGPAGYLISIVASAIVTGLFLVALVFILRPDVLEAAGVPRTEPLAPAPTTVADLPPTATPQPVAVVRSGQSVNVRSGPGTSFGAVAAAQPGTSMTVLGQDDSGGWYNVRLSDGVEGWVSADLLTLDAAAPPPASPQSDAPPAEITPEVAACDPAEVQTWWDETASLPYYQMVFALDQFPQDFAAEDYQRIYDMVRAARTSFDEASYPACVETRRAQLLETFDEVILAVREIANNMPQNANNRAAAARSTFQTVLTALETDYGTDVAITNCGAEVWAAGAMPEMDRLFTALGSVDLNTSALEDVRGALFEMQRFRRFMGKLAAPECVKVANESLLGALDDFIAMYQAAISGDRTTASNRLAAATSRINTFEAEMRKLGL